MHLFFNDPRVGYVTRHSRVGRASWAGLVVGGVGVAALGVFVGAASFERAPVEPQVSSTGGTATGGGLALPVATPRVGETDANGPLNLGTVPAAPVPVLEVEAPRSTRAAKAKAPKRPRRAPEHTVSVAPPPATHVPAAQEPMAPVPTAPAPAAQEPTAQEPAVQKEPVVQEEPDAQEPQDDEEPSDDDEPAIRPRPRWHPWWWAR